MTHTRRLERLTRLGEGLCAPVNDLRHDAAREIRRCARLGLRDTMVAHLYASRAERLADLLADGPQGRASTDDSERATAALRREIYG